jgi:acetyltransferase-like isoleucine patch superfamily enzyme
VQLYRCASTASKSFGLAELAEGRCHDDALQKMNIALTDPLIGKLHARGISTLLRPGAILPQDCAFEPPCSLKWMNVQHSLQLGAFSYAVSGFYFGCRIGRYCSFGEQVQIGRHPHAMHWVSTSPFFHTPYRNVLDQDLPSGVDLTPFKDYKRNTRPVQAKLTTLGNDVWIGHGAFVLPGVTVGDGAVIAAMAVVTKDVPPYAVVAGSPARVVRLRFPEAQVKLLLESRWWDFAPWQLKGAKVDDVDDFVAHVLALRAQGVAAHAPAFVALQSLV